jgi:hypothetical protein
LNTANLAMDKHQSNAPKRRWYQFSLRVMFVVVTLASIPLAWAGCSLSWIRQRHEWLEKHDGRADGNIVLRTQWWHDDQYAPPPAPGGLWLFGEEGIWEIHPTSDHAELTKRLFPEASIIVDEP